MQTYRITFHTVGGVQLSTEMRADKVTDLPNSWNSTGLLTIVDNSYPDERTFTVNMRNVHSITYKLIEKEVAQ